MDPSEVDTASLIEDDDAPVVRSDKKKKKKKEDGDKSPSKTIDAFFKPVAGKSSKKGDVSATSEESSDESDEEDENEDEDDMDEDEDEDEKPKRKKPTAKSTKVVVTGAKAKPKPAAKKEAIKEEAVVKTEGVAADASAANGTASEPIKVETAEEPAKGGRKSYVRPEGEEGWRNRYPKALAADKAFRKRIYSLNPYYVARILKIAGRRNSNMVKIHVQVFYRLKQVKGKKALGSDREIFYTEYVAFAAQNDFEIYRLILV